MPYRDRKMYKNPKLPKAADLQTTQGAPRDRKEPMAPQRAGGGMLQMAAQARARQPKEGTPPIPSAAAPATPAPGREADPRALAARRMADQGLGSQAMGGGGGQPPPKPTPFGPQYKPGTELEKEGPIEPLTWEKPDLGPPDTDLGPMKVLALLSGEPVDKEGPSYDDTEIVAKQEYADTGADPGGAGPSSPYFKEPEEKPVEATGYKTKGAPVYDSEGNIIGYEEGTDVPLAGQEVAVAPEGAVEPAERNKYERMEKFFMDYLEQATGIPPEELQGQIAGLEAAGYDQMAKFAQQMAARGMSMSGVTGQGMGQIMTQTMLGIANLRFENAKLAVEERMNKIKNFMAFYGNVMSEANKSKHLEEMAQLEKDKFQYDKEQNALSDKWVAVKNILALTGSEKWDLEALGWAFRAIDNGVDPALVAEWLDNDGTTVGKKPGAPDYPGMEAGEVGPPPEGGFGEGSAAYKNSYPDYMTDEQYKQYVEYGQPPTELGWVDDATGGKKWADMTGSQRHLALGWMRAKNKGFDQPPSGWQDANSDKVWGEMGEEERTKVWGINVMTEGAGGEPTVDGMMMWVALGNPHPLAALGDLL